MPRSGAFERKPGNKVCNHTWLNSRESVHDKQEKEMEKERIKFGEEKLNKSICFNT
jgi:hypothetical protein